MVTPRSPRNIDLPFPFVTGLERRTQEELYMDFLALGRGGGTRWRTIVIAAANSVGPNADAADYRCPGAKDQATINAAISKLESLSSSASLGRIVLLEGTYFCDDSIVINALTSRSLAIEGMSGPAQGSTLGVSGTVINCSHASHPTFDIAGVGGDPSGTVILENMHVVAATTDYAVKSRDMTMHVRNVRVTNTGAAGGGIGQTNSTGGSSNTIVDGCYVTPGSGGNGIFVVTGPTRSTVSYVRNNTVNISGAGAVGISTGNDISSTPAYHVNDNTVYGNSAATQCGISCNGTSTQNNVVCDNFVYKCATGIRVAGYKNIIASNLLELCPTGISDNAFQLDSSFIVGNNIVDSATVGITLGTQNCNKNGILGNKVVGYAITVPVACQINGLATSTHVYYNDFDTGVTTPVVDTGTGTASQSGIPSGGTLGQLLAKRSSGAGDVQWVTDYVLAAVQAAGDIIVASGAGAIQKIGLTDIWTAQPTWSARILIQSPDAPFVRWGPTVTVGTVAPATPQAGDIWIDTT